MTMYMILIYKCFYNLEEKNDSVFQFTYVLFVFVSSDI